MPSLGDVPDEAGIEDLVVPEEVALAEPSQGEEEGQRGGEKPDPERGSNRCGDDRCEKPKTRFALLPHGLGFAPRS